ncbi:GRF zinc finger containing protein [Striga asiatica]|uniref:GRF zinc finger containing protein n=1 Tax=Striga asiatica TaxID=4170 RepID=A0A5A7Q3W0_STRAF|nr:GRF zinc finger containing protein [Striga asiatica]
MNPMAIYGLDGGNCCALAAAVARTIVGPDAFSGPELPTCLRNITPGRSRDGVADDMATKYTVADDEAQRGGKHNKIWRNLSNTLKICSWRDKSHTYNMSFVMGSVDCYCGRRAVIRTSWTTENPGRRFQACLKNEEEGGCVFFDWNDPPMCRRAKALIPGLLKKMNASEEEILKLKTETLAYVMNV